jgi:hypothetical protein
MSGEISEKERAMAKKCLECALCKQARQKQRGFAFWFVKKSRAACAPIAKPMRRFMAVRPMSQCPEPRRKGAGICLQETAPRRRIRLLTTKSSGGGK